MEVILVRSPYFIEVNETSQVESKLELFIWDKGGAEPAFPTYTLSKKAPSPDQPKNIYNISNYVKEFINITKPTFVSTPIEEDDKNWCYVKVKRYKATTVGSFSLLDTTTYVALNGFTNYLSGYNYSYNEDFLALTSASDKVSYKYYYTTEEEKPYLNFYINYTDDTDIYEVYYESLDGVNNSTETILDGDTETQYVFKIPLTTSSANYIDGNKMNILLNDEIIFEYNYINECETKYNPILCYFINKFGGWEYITFFKARVENWEVKNKDYKLLPNDVDYNIYRGESKMFNYDARKSIKINTGWLNESYNDLIQDLMVSETILLGNVPVKLKTMSTDLKTSLQDKMINYQIEFEYNYNQINNVI
jgi:hypothetical protein